MSDKHFAVAEIAGQIQQTAPARSGIRLTVAIAGGSIEATVYRPGLDASPGLHIHLWGRLRQWGQQRIAAIDVHQYNPRHGYALLVQPPDPHAGWTIRGTLQGIGPDATALVQVILPATTAPDGTVYPERRNEYLVHLQPGQAEALRPMVGKTITLRGSFHHRRHTDGHGRVREGLVLTCTEIVPGRDATRTQPAQNTAPVNGPAAARTSPPQTQTTTPPAPEAGSQTPVLPF